MPSTLEELLSRYHFSRQETLLLEKMERDRNMWDMGSVALLVDYDKVDRASSGQRSKLAFQMVSKAMDAERRKPTDYRDFDPPDLHRAKPRGILTAPETFMGRCPCPTDGEQTRCFNLKTLDAVEQCPFGCSYCAVQTFYGSGEIKVVGNLKERLSTIELPADVWHIGTGQSSDSLLWGNDYGTLDALKVLANRYPRCVIELKTKSARTDWISDDWPKNMVATWSLNAPLITEKEELLTAPIESRLHAARMAADHHIPIGFHLHPMVWFEGWQEAYRNLVGSLTSLFKPQEIMMVSMGTLTFTKSVLKALRAQGRPSRILDMELVPFAGKFSYPYETKLKLFQNAYQAFPDSWKEKKDTNPFFYLCFEDPKLWKPVMGYEYPSNEMFEMSMKKQYLATVDRFTNGR